MSLLENAYVYGIKINNETVYIGKTYQPLMDRIEDHVLQCHNTELKDAMLHNKYEFYIIYESHNAITSEILNTIEEAFITQLQPKYNKCGVTIPYNTFTPKTAFSGGGIASQLALKKYYTQQDIQQLLLQNFAIKNVILVSKDAYYHNFFSNKFDHLPRNQQDAIIEHQLGKINNFNEMTSYGFLGFRQKGYGVMEDGQIRFPTIDEKLNGIPKEKLTYCHVIFFFNEKCDYEELNKQIYKDFLSITDITDESTKMDAYMDNSMMKMKLQEALENYGKQQPTYYPLKIITIDANHLDTSYSYLDTWFESTFIS